MGMAAVLIGGIVAGVAVCRHEPRAPLTAKVGAPLTPVHAYAPDFTLNQGDANVPWAVPVFDTSGVPINIAGATVEFRYRILDGSASQVQNAGSVTGTLPPGLATYKFKSVDTATPGNYNASFVITLPTPDGGVDGSAETFVWPQDHFLHVTVRGPP